MTAFVGPGTVADHPDVRALAVRTLGSDYQVHSRRQFHVTDAELLLAHEDGELVGFLTLEVAPPMAEVLAIATILPRQGVGAALMGEAEAVCRRRGCSRVSVVTTDANVDAQRFYTSLGYTVAEVVVGGVDECRRLYKPAIPPDMHDEIRFERALD